MGPAGRIERRTRLGRVRVPGRDFATWVEVDLSAITGNVETARRLSGVAVMAVVKADAYGHGAVPVARAALAGGASWLGVARPEEAHELRAAGIAAPILLLGYAPPGALIGLVAADVALSVWTGRHIDEAADAAAVAGRPARLHLKTDTGMSRIGCAPADAVGLAKAADAAPGVELQGLFTHFACADDVRGASVTTGQQREFAAALVDLERAGLRPPLVHAANSAGTLAVPGAGYDMVRFGIAMYGLSPGPQVPLPAGIRPALTWRSVLAQVKRVPAGRGISYGHTYVTDHGERIGTVPVGYADGWRRTPGNEVLVDGVRVPVRGRVCMDQCMLGLDGAPEAAAGGEVVLIGEQGGERITADDVAERWGTIGYEVVCGIGKRVPRLYPPLDRREGGRRPAGSGTGAHPAPE